MNVTNGFVGTSVIISGLGVVREPLVRLWQSPTPCEPQAGVIARLSSGLRIGYVGPHCHGAPSRERSSYRRLRPLHVDRQEGQVEPL